MPDIKLITAVSSVASRLLANLAQSPDFAARQLDPTQAKDEFFQMHALELANMLEREAKNLRDAVDRSLDETPKDPLLGLKDTLSQERIQILKAGNPTDKSRSRIMQIDALVPELARYETLAGRHREMSHLFRPGAIVHFEPEDLHLYYDLETEMKLQRAKLADMGLEEAQAEISPEAPDAPGGAAS